MDVCFYSQGNTQKLSTNVKYNSSPRISNSGRIVGWGSDHLNSPSTVNIYRSLNRAAAEQVAVNGVFPNITICLARLPAGMKTHISLCCLPRLHPSLSGCVSCGWSWICQDASGPV